MKNNVQQYSKTFYSGKVLIRAIDAYKKIANIRLSDAGEYYRCEFSNCAVDTQLVMNEFGNYLIELSNSNGDSIE